MDEENLIQSLKDGDMSAIDEIYRSYSVPALRTAYLITSERHTAEDVLQDTFIQCIKSINSLKNNSSFKPWFYKILIIRFWSFELTFLVASGSIFMAI